MAAVDFPHVRVGEHTIAYRHAGHGPALVLLHGFLCDSQVWEPQLTGLASQFNVVAWDAPGAGLSSDPPESFTITDWSNCLVEFLDRIGIPQAHLAGLSWGGLLAQELYRLHPARILSLVLAGTYPGWRGSFPPDVVQQRLDRCMREAWLPPEEFVPRWVPEFFTEAASPDVQRAMEAVVSGFHPAGFRLMAKSLAETDTTELLPNIKAPTLLLWGDDDRRSSLAIAAQFQAAMPNAQLEVIQGAGHISNMEQPERFNDLVRRFCLSHNGKM